MPLKHTSLLSLATLLLAAITPSAFAAPAQLPLLPHNVGSGSVAAFLEKVGSVLVSASKLAYEAEWRYATNITSDNQEAATEAELVLNELIISLLAESRTYTGTTPDEKRKLHLLSLYGGVPTSTADQRALSTVQGEMSAIYSTARYKGLALEPDLTELMATEREWDVLLDAWLGWRHVTGPHLKYLYTTFATLSNIGAHDGGFADTGAQWRAGYDMDGAAFISHMEDVWEQVLPLYEQLHCYVRGKLGEVYGEERVDGKDGLIPAHLLGKFRVRQ
ncbi:hypothetical protein BDK51DRAFT_47182 [Blyttiomyces helicus]|uniref:Angiotensin-converting enzyme n=1 Tax=Blyttiomyces helicus TaxID=388810 RepID=A0A4P9WEJ4_9FUNG|nr:hypothetical protein BDK51DRAFT_47182 [Blyttiomyces helicus]|eukprot:RKO90205.1 hypothetical protein BDK51DRAFT_47182 [Blyttiomyces helicus]